MAFSFRLELDRDGVREAVLRSDGVRRLIEETAESVATKARGNAPRVDGEPGEQPVPIIVEPAHGKTRARALVVIDHPSGLAVEAKHRTLGGALR